MSDQLVSELIELCRAITDDGQLTNKELYSLAEWLNAHPAAHGVWPGNQLIGPLQEVWTDGEITPAELTRIGRVLYEIEEEWARRQPPIHVTEFVSAFDPSAAILPKVGFVGDVISSSGVGPYRVDLNTHTCTCADWAGTRANLPSQSLGRCCKHVARALLTSSRGKDWPGWLTALLTDCEGRDRGTNPNHSWLIITVEGAAILIGFGEIEWVNLYAPKKTNYRRFGYNVAQRRWAYGDAPIHASAIRTAIHERVPV